MSVLICGSMAYDNIMVFRGRFRDHILPDQIHILNVAFLVPEMRQELGGCAGNIAYNLRLLGGEPLIMATVGRDFDRYRARLAAHGLEQRYITAIPEALTAQAYITTDLDANQITAFHPGAMEHSHLNRVPASAGIAIGVVSPDGRQGMVDHAAQFAAAGIPWMFDPGQGLPMFDGDELRRFIDQAAWVTVNDYEGRLLTERSGWSEAEIASRVRALVITRGGEGSTIFAAGRRIDIPPVAPARIADPTGCGDAYRAGLLHGISRNLPWEETGRLASLIGALKIAQQGTQNHGFTPASLAADYRAAFGQAIAL
ncbi:MAG: sugar kinase [Gammaproteobacteria bacterium]|nr:MAG: carbohydrate kinase family protein [Pseudomonadota bacterium]MBC6945940.1 carbohydrate kinase family protein [Gammaproteobacteria bacterium]MCQ3933604.1 carbohydrate kinase family protein [Gammaproteobacteria bacterium]MDL1881365.1 carbohydrate kinase family protein [Gammaproteobacteria bacterium PRO2]GIK35194.1 MAG: sugar kinase [Gammaproteobacteria bacterium]